MHLINNNQHDNLDSNSSIDINTYNSNTGNTKKNITFANANKVMLSSMAVASLLLISGCATTKLTPEQCEMQNWKEVGILDGKLGRSGNYFGKYSSECAGSSLQPNREQWEAGRQQGLTSYCTQLNAYKLGREGYAWQPVCPLDGIDKRQSIEKLEDAYREGRLNYLREQQLNRWNDWWDDDYPWRHRHRGNWGRYYW